MSVTGGVAVGAAHVLGIYLVNFENSRKFIFRYLLSFPPPPIKNLLPPTLVCYEIVVRKLGRFYYFESIFIVRDFSAYTFLN